MRAWIHEGRIAADSLVWREGWQDWREAGKTFPQLLGEATPVFTQPLPSAVGQGLSPSVAVYQQRVKAKQKSKRSQMLVIAGLVLAVVVLVVVLAIVSWPTGDTGKEGGKSAETNKTEAGQVESKPAADAGKADPAKADAGKGAGKVKAEKKAAKAAAN